MQASDVVVEGDLCTPPPKRKCVQNKELCVDEESALQSPVLRRTLQKLLEYKAKDLGCPNSVLGAILNAKSARMVLQHVMQIAFQDQWNILYKNGYYYIEGKWDKPCPTKRVELCISEEFCDGGGGVHAVDVAYNLHRRGYNFADYDRYLKQYYAVYIACGYRDTRVHELVHEFVCFLEKDPRMQEQLIDKKAERFNEGLKDNDRLDNWAISVAKMLWLMPVNVRAKINKLMQIKATPAKIACNVPFNAQPYKSVLEPPEKVYLKKTTQELVLAYLKKHGSTEEGCKLSALKSIVGNAPVWEVLMRVVFGKKINIAYKQLGQRVYYLGPHCPKPHKNLPPVALFMADLICDKAVKFSLGQVAWKVFEVGYVFKNFDVFEKQYMAVRIILNRMLSERQKCVREFAYELRRKQVSKAQIPSFFSDFNMRSKCAISKFGRKIGECIFLMPQDVFEQLEAKSLKRVFLKKRPVCVYGHNQELEETIHASIRTCKALTLTDLRKCFAAAHSYESRVFKQVLHYIFSHNMGIFYNAIENNFTFAQEKKDTVKPSVPAASIIAAALFGESISVYKRALLGCYLYTAGYEFESYADYEAVFNAAAIEGGISVVRVHDITRCQGFWRYLEQNPSDDRLSIRMKNYQECGGDIREEDMFVIESTLGFKECGDFDIWLEVSKGNRSCLRTKMVAKILQESAKNNESCAFAVLELFAENALGRKNPLTVIMDAVFKHNLSVDCNLDKRVCWLLDPSEIQEPKSHVFDVALSMLRANPLWGDGEFALALHKEGYCFSDLAYVQKIKYLLQNIEDLLAHDHLSLLRCRMFFDVETAEWGLTKLSARVLLNNFSAKGMNLKSREREFVINVRLWEWCYGPVLCDVKEILSHFCLDSDVREKKNEDSLEKPSQAMPEREILPPPDVLIEPLPELPSLPDIAVVPNNPMLSYADSPEVERELIFLDLDEEGAPQEKTEDDFECLL